MPKRAQFAPGFAELRGNISGRQNLEYPTNDNKAFYGPIDGKNYARNYRASVIVSQRARDGKFYYSIRTKSMNHLTAKSKKAMALLGGAGAVYAAILANPSLLAGIQAQYAAVQELGEKRSFRKYVMDTVRQGLIKHDGNFTFAGPVKAVVVNNPWETTLETPNISVSRAILVKFWGELASGGIYFNVSGLTGISKTGVTFMDLTTGMDAINILGLSRDSLSYVKMGDSYLLTQNGEYVLGSVSPTNNQKFSTTDTAPNA